MKLLAFEANEAPPTCGVYKKPSTPLSSDYRCDKAAVGYAPPSAWKPNQRTGCLCAAHAAEFGFELP